MSSICSLSDARVRQTWCETFNYQYMFIFFVGTVLAACKLKFKYIYPGMVAFWAITIINFKNENF